MNQNGRDLAVVTGQSMKGIHFDDCISSPLKRSVETCEIILNECGCDIPIKTDERIREIYFGSLEGKPLSAMGEPGELFFDDPFNFIGFPEGECIQEVSQRTQSFLRDLLSRADDKTYLIGMHGCAVRAMLNYLYEDPSDFWHGHVPYNCSVNIIEEKNGIVKLIADDKIYYDLSLIKDFYK